MIKPLPLLGIAAAMLALAGCRSGNVPELYRPGSTPTWRTVASPGAGAGVRTDPAEERTQVLVRTSMGSFTIELFEEQAPVSTANFLAYVDRGFYDGTLFHRVIPGFMVQGGGFVTGMVEKATEAPIENESDNGLANRRGTVAMARTSDLDSAAAQFFVNLVDNAFLNGGSLGDGYTVFGRVVEGMEVVDQIATVPTATSGNYDDVPVEPVFIVTARRTQ